MTRLKRAILLSAAGALGLVASAGAVQTASKPKGAAVAAGAAKVEAVGLAIDKPGPPMKFGQLAQEGTRVILRVSLPGKTIVELDPAASKLTGLKDDKGADLSKEPPKPKDQGPVFRFGNDMGGPLKAEKVQDGQSCLVEVKGPAVPSPGATRIAVRGTLVFTCGAGEKTDEQKNLPLTEGAPITAGPVPMTISLKKNPGFGGNFPGQPAALNGSRFAIHTEGSAEAIKSIAFWDDNGKEIKSEVTMTAFGGSNMNGPRDVFYALEKKVDQVTIRVKHVDHLEKMSIPIDVNVGVGL